MSFKKHFLMHILNTFSSKRNEFFMVAQKINTKIKIKIKLEILISFRSSSISLNCKYFQIVFYFIEYGENKREGRAKKCWILFAQCILII